MPSPILKTLRPWLILLLILGAVGYSLWKFLPNSSSQNHQGPPGMGGPGASRAGPPGAGRGGPPGGGRRGMFGESMLVSVATVKKAPLSVQLEAVGTVTSLNTVNVTARVDGQLSKILFTEGQEVKQGDVLAEIDARPYQAALKQAEGVVSQYTAQLKNAEIDLARYQELREEDSIAIQTIDTQNALVRQYKGNLENAEGQVEAARLNLDFTKIRAPINGRIGLRQIDVGNQVTANSTTPITVLTQTRPISVVFSLPEQQLNTVRQQLKRNPDKLVVDALDRQRASRIARGKVISLDNQIDTTTGTFKLRASFANADDSLYPNQFVNVRLNASEVESALLIPSGALQRDDEGTYVYGIDGEKKVSKLRVVVGVSQAEQVEIRQGLVEGQRIVTEGVDRLADGMTVRVAGDAEDTRPHRTPGAGEGRHGQWRQQKEGQPAVNPAQPGQPQPPAQAGGQRS
ncbi:MdtA/MuxA family multidrug efflux RND transporter periplasmic adaptor subunit [Methylobacillus gramineus]|uniref:MdtA/MuxA family multidrug efflux RND transporter periplasmic adaptor subunit n=1 Tax=Methylobacillus gramineus TaxID=755169 RepID=UPI001CFFE1F3|nr:MdtA/MuxA family multidrug efflux RND transporter periplasmic adaptor subunit [Methylobacillus gramineus]MCB5184919.1 MdtA/MuxA family multidrug efflux RND transporter periplasmic adaptor subunit [Methylobacillus gramineus]